VYRLGDASDMDVYIIGKTDDGYYAGVSTRIVET
jgi:predicted GIY-YIG superfamily endonuclease